MKRKKLFHYKFLLVLLIPLLFASCENSTGNKNPQPVSSQTFPNMVGDKWVYAIHDSLSHTVDTLEMKIVGTTTANGKSLTIWARKSSVYKDTFYVSINNDTVNYYDDPIPNVVDHKLIFPLKTGNFWKNPNQLSDSTTVTGQDLITVPADTFNDAYRIERNWTSFNIRGYSITWFVNNVGIVKMYRRVQGFDNIQETWDLLSYTVY